MKNLLLLAAFIASVTTFAQNNFTYTPEKPKPGDEIRFTYTPSGDLAGVMQIPEAFVLRFTTTAQEVKDINLKREYGKLSGSFKTDTSTRTLAFGFTLDDKYDNNQNNGYIIQLNDDEGNPLLKSYSDLGSIYASFGENRLGMKKDNARAIKAYEGFFKIHPELKNDELLTYLTVVYNDDKEKGTAAVQKEIEATLKNGLKEEKEYQRLANLYLLIRLRQQSTFITKLKREKYPPENKGIGADQFYQYFMGEPDVAKKEKIVAEVMEASKKAANAQEFESLISFCIRNLAQGYATQKDWDSFKKFAAQITDEGAKVNLYNSTAWGMQEDNVNLKLAEEFSAYAVKSAKIDWKNPKGEKPSLQRYSEWIKRKENLYATYADTYAMVLYRMGQYKKAMSYAREAQAITKGESADHNMTFALLAEKTMKPRQYKPLIEQFVKDGKTNKTINDVLKKLYVTSNGSEAGFDNYIAGLEKEAYAKMLADLKKDMLNDATPRFSLKDLSGNTVNIADLKGKTVVVDFWATWCGPCIASMPGMQKMVNKYKDDPNVKFLFVDTWQNEDNESDLVKKFIADKGYEEFHVLMDLDDKVVSQFKVEGIPTKFIVGKDGNIKFKEIGFDGEENLVKKLPAMIELAN